MHEICNGSTLPRWCKNRGGHFIADPNTRGRSRNRSFLCFAHKEFLDRVGLVNSDGKTLAFCFAISHSGQHVLRRWRTGI